VTGKRSADAAVSRKPLPKHNKFKVSADGAVFKV